MDPNDEEYLPRKVASEESNGFGDADSDDVSDISIFSEEEEEEENDIVEPSLLPPEEDGPYGHNLRRSFHLPLESSDHSQSQASVVSGANLISNRLSVGRRSAESMFSMNSRFTSRAGARNSALVGSMNSRFPVVTGARTSAPGAYRSMFDREQRSQSIFQEEMRFDRGSFAHSRDSSSSQRSPYYEHTGGWLRLRPQKPANFTERSRFLNSISQPSSNGSASTFSKYHHHDLMSRIPPSLNKNTNYRQVSDKQLSLKEEDDAYFAEERKIDEEEGNVEIPDSFANLDIGKGNNRLQEDLSSAKPTNQEEGKRTDILSKTENDGDVAEEMKQTYEHEAQAPSDRSPFDGNSMTSPSRQASVVDTRWASSDSKYEIYACRVDQNQGDKAVEIPLFLFQRPHMRAFHFAWMSFFAAFFTWFAISPLLPEIKSSLRLSHQEIWMSNVFSSAGTVICRIIVGPLNDRFGARWVMASTLAIAAIPVMATGLVHNAVELSILRLITGVAGSTFVTCQYWTSSMFTREISGTANSLAAGWGNLGGGITQIVMGSVLFPLFKLIYKETGDDTDTEDASADRAWRTVCVVPAIFSLVMAFLVIKYSDDSPKGNYKKLQRLRLMPNVEAKKVLKAAASDYNTWLLAFHYGCCFGAEVTFTAGAALYFSEEFNQKTESAAALASIFGWMNLFARGMGGFVSDIANVKFGMRGRLLWQFGTIVLEGIFLIAFGYTTTMSSAISIMIFLSVFVQNAEVRERLSILVQLFCNYPSRHTHPSCFIVYKYMSRDPLIALYPTFVLTRQDL